MRKITFLRNLIVLVALLIGSSAMGQYSGTGTFTKITSLVDLTDGYYVVVNSGDGFAMNNTNAGSYFAHTAVTPSTGTIVNPATSIVWKIETNGGGRSIYNEASAKFVSYTGSSNAAYAVDAVTSNNQRWTFTYASNVFTVANVALTTRILQYNASSPRFACYTSAQQKLLLYKLTVEEEPETPTITVSESTVPAMSAEVGATDTETITVSGVNLEGNITLALSGDNADYFDLSTLSIAPADGTVTDVVVTITYAPEAAGSHTATLTLSSTNATDVVKTLTGTANWPPLAKPNATDASGIGQAGFTANWDAVAGATEYELSVYTKEEGDLAEFDYGFEGSTSLPENWTGDGYVVNGAANANTGTYYAGLNATPKYIRTDLVTNPSSVSFYYRYSSATANNTVKVQVSSNGSDWTDVGNPYVATGSGATITYVYSSIDLNLTGQYYIQWVMSARTGGSFYFDDVKISAGSPDVQTPISGFPFTVTDGTSKAITGLTPSTTYYYTVVAKNANVDSEVSNEISVVTSFGTSTGNPSTLTNIYAHNDKIHFTATAGEKVEVYNAVGQKIISTLATDGQNELPVNAKGVMIVKVGSRLAKVIL